MWRPGVHCSPNYGWELGTQAGVRSQLWLEPAPTHARRHGSEHGEQPPPSAFSPLQPWGKVLLTPRVMPWVFSTQFLLHVVESQLDVLVLVLNEVPAGVIGRKERMGRWYQSFTQNLMTVVTGELRCSEKAEERTNHPWLPLSPWMGPCCRQCTCQMPAIGLQTSIIFSLLLLDVLLPLPPWTLSVAHGNNLRTPKAGWIPEEAVGRNVVFSAGWMYSL